MFVYKVYICGVVKIVWCSLLILAFFIITGFYRVPFTLTWMDLFDRKLVMKNSILPFTSYSMRVFAILHLQIVSKAFSIPEHTTAMYSMYVRMALHEIPSSLRKLSIVNRTIA